MIYRYFIKISFDGTAYNGWQVQKNSSQTVQQKINDGLSQLLNEKIEVHGCCRTDAGVHAKELFAHFDSFKSNLHKDSTVDWIYRFNKMVPVDISIDKIYSAKNNANARFDATSRTYQYLIHQRRNPFLLNKSWYYYSDLDLGLMNKATAVLKKHKDFSAFSKMNTQAKTNICRIDSAKWTKNKAGDLVFTISADRFLRSMIRMIVGTMVQLGKHKMSLNDFEEIINQKDCRNASPLAPACGLYLLKVKYPQKIFLK